MIGRDRIMDLLAKGAVSYDRKFREDMLRAAENLHRFGETPGVF